MKGFIIAGIIFLILIIGIVCLYYFIEKPKSDEVIETIQYSIAAQDSSNKFIKTGYKIYIEGNLFEDSQTSTKSFIAKDLPKNKSITIFNYNLNGQNYYIDIIYTNHTLVGPIRASLKLIKAGELKITHNSNSIVNVEAIGMFKNMIFCLRGSGRIIYLRANNFNQTNATFGYSSCYLGSTLSNENLSISLTYNVFGTLTKNDYIKILFFDNNYEPYSNEIKQTKQQNYTINF